MYVHVMHQSAFHTGLKQIQSHMVIYNALLHSFMLDLVQLGCKQKRVQSARVPMFLLTNIILFFPSSEHVGA